jgi:hypothetical protein
MGHAAGWLRTMKTHWKVGIGLAALGVAGAVFFLNSGHREQTAVEKTRLELRQQGFKTDLADFHLSAASELQARAEAFYQDRGVRPAPVLLNHADLMVPVGEHAAVVTWKQAELAHPSGFAEHEYEHEAGAAKNVWPVLRENLQQEQEHLDAAAAAALSGPIRFDLDARQGSGMLLPHLAGLRYYTQMLGCRAMLALHDRDTNAAWTNLLAATRIVTAWQTEPAEISQYIRADCLETVYDLTWQAMQAGDWPDERLAQLQREWEGLDLFGSLPDTIAFAGACHVALQQQERQRPPPSARPPFPSRGSGNPIAALMEYFRLLQEARYLRQGTYEDERDMLRFNRDRELEIRRALQCRTWAEMRPLPGVTNEMVFQSRYKNHGSRVQAMMRMRRTTMMFQGNGLSLMARLAEAEARRRLALTALALERFRVRHSSYPKTLDELVPDFLKAPPVDFMDGQPLRYTPTVDGHFLLYSVGLDCVDDGGKMPPPIANARRALAMSRLMGNAGSSAGSDLVWPSPAPAAAAKAHADETEKQIELAKAAREQAMAEEATRAETARQATVRQLLSDPKYRHATWSGGHAPAAETMFQGQPLSKFLRHLGNAGTNQFTLDELLTLNPVHTGGEPEVITCELPIRYDELSNHLGAELTLAMDSPPAEPGLSQPELQGCERATNGDCRLVWSSAFEKPGPHAMQAVLLLTPRMDEMLEVRGPVASFFSSNLCQFFPASSLFNDQGAYLCAQLAEPKAGFRIEVKTLGGAHVRTFSGTTTNGTINVEWDLVDDKGIRYTNNSFNSVFNVTLTNGRSQTLTQRQNKLGTRGD